MYVPRFNMKAGEPHAYIMFSLEHFFSSVRPLCLSFIYIQCVATISMLQQILVVLFHTPKYTVLRNTYSIKL